MSSLDANIDDTAELNVPYDCVGLRLDVALARLFDFIPSRSFGQKLIESGAVLVSGSQRRPSWKLFENETIAIKLSAIRPPPSFPLPQSIPLNVVFEDDDILVINKTVGLVVHPGAGVPDGTLVNAVLAHTGCTLPSLGDPLRAGIVHRLDRDTSGIMVVAKSQLALTDLSRQFAEHSQLRRYVALVFGAMNPTEQTIETWHGRDPKNRLRYASVAEGQGKLARMKVRTMQVFAGGRASLVECELYTGRTHQIRVQMAHIGHGLLGDSLYGPAAASGAGTALTKDKGLWARVRASSSRQMLHAAVLGLRHPKSGESLTFKADPPADFMLLSELLRVVD
ncbi:MAG: hypothetical protein RJB13_1763 [Pseudomonadota bacterium]